MDDGAATERLFATGVLTARDGAVTTTAEFESDVEAYVDELAATPFDEVVRRVRDRVGREGVAEPLAELGDEDPRTTAELCALHDRLDPSDDGKWLSLLPVLRLFRPRGAPTHGVPEAFVPVPASHLPHLARVYSPAVAYVWLDDCPPCETLKEDLEAIFETPREAMPFAVYGPDDSAFLDESFDVTAGPALLFMRDGDVDARLYGAQPRATVESELSKLADG